MSSIWDDLIAALARAQDQNVESIASGLVNLISAASEASNTPASTTLLKAIPTVPDSPASISGTSPGMGPDAMIAESLPRTTAAESGDVARLDDLVSKLTDAAAAQESTLEANANLQSRTRQQASSSGGNGIGDVLSEVFGGAFSFGISPLITGLMGLFGGDDNGSAQASFVKFSLPPSVSEEAGIDLSNAIVPISYDSLGSARGSTASVAPMNINLSVSAMDSQSFLDHSEDIAQAVKQAMLYSHPLNDIVTDL